MRFRDGIGFGVRVAAGVAVGHLVAAVISPPDDWPRHIGVSLIATGIGFLVGALAEARRANRRDNDRN